MHAYTVEETSELAAPAPACYSVIADYRDGHPRIVPPRVFLAIDVEEGGVGAGTRLRVTVRGFGGSRTMHLVVTEPEPGRVLAEHDVNADTRTHFIVEPLDGARSRVTIRTDFPAAAGFRAAIEGWLTRRLLPGVFREELRRLEAVAAERAA